MKGTPLICSDWPQLMSSFMKRLGGGCFMPLRTLSDNNNNRQNVLCQKLFETFTCIPSFNLCNQLCEEETKAQ